MPRCSSNSSELCNFLLKDGVAIIYTDTVMGLAAKTEKGLKKIFEIKKRDKNKRIATLIDNFDFKDHKINKIFKTGKLTVISKGIGYRRPNFLELKKVIKKIGPIYCTSFNLSGEDPYNSIEKAKIEIISKVDFIWLKKPKNIFSSPSAVYSLDENTLLRKSNFISEEFFYMTISLGHDHTVCKSEYTKIIKFLEDQNINVIHRANLNDEKSNYSVYGIEVAKDVTTKKADFGIVICGTGIGISIAANKVKGARAALVYDEEIAKISRNHNDANILATGIRVISIDKILRIIDSFLNSSFEGDRHKERLNYIKNYEDAN